MANHDVQLIIRAKNDASKALDAVSAAFKNLTEGQKTFGQTATKTDSLLNKLGVELTKLSAAAKGSNAFSSLTQNVDRAAAAIGRMEEKVAEAATEQARLAQEARNAAAATADFRAKSEAANAETAKRRAALDAEKTSLKALNTEISKTSSARTSASNSYKKAGEDVEKWTKKVSEAIAKKRSLDAELAAAQTAGSRTAGLQTRADAADVQANKAVSKLFQSMSAQEQALGTMQRADAALADLKSRADAATASVQREQAAFEGAAVKAREMSEAVNTAVRAEKTLDGTIKTVENNLRYQNTTLETAKVEMQGLSQAAASGEAALSKLAMTSRGELRAALDQQRSILAGLKEQMVSYQESLARNQGIVTAGSKGGYSTDQIKAAQTEISRANAMIAATRGVIDSQLASVTKMSQAYRAAGNDIDKLAQAHRVFSSEVSSTNARLAPFSSALRANQQSALSNAGANNKLSDSLRRVNGAFSEHANKGREAMSVMQRLRAEVLAYATAVAGIQGTINMFRNVADAAIDVQVAQSRLNVVSGGDTEKTALEFAWTRREAERLGFDIRTLTKEWSTFAVAAQGTSMTLAESRKIFVSVAQAARTLNLSGEAVSRMYVALTQMMSKGTISMEELRQQLGEHLPGAFKLMADSIGVTSSELMKLMKAGDVDASNLIKFAAKLDEQFGDQLPQALMGLRPEIERFKTQWVLAMREVGEMGVVEAMTQNLRDLNKALHDGGANSALSILANTMGFLLKVVRALAENVQLLTFAFSTLIGVKVMAALIGMAVSAVELVGRLKDLFVIFRSLRAGIVAFEASLAAAAMTARVFWTAVAGVGAGIVGALAGGLFGLWVTKNDKAADAIRRHKDALEGLRVEYALAGGELDKMDKAFKTRALLDFAEGLKTSQAELSRLRAEIGRTEVPIAGDIFSTGLPGYDVSEEETRAIAAIKALREEFLAGKMSALDFRNELTRIAEAAPFASVERFTDDLIELSKKADGVEQAVGDYRLGLNVLNGTATDAEKVQGRFSDSLDAASDAAKNAEASLKRYHDAILEIRKAGKGGAEVIDAQREKAGVDLATKYENVKRDIEGDQRITQEQRQVALADAEKAYKRAEKDLDAFFNKKLAQTLPVNYDRLVERIIYNESGGNPLAKSSRSSASGVGQFTDDTWVRVWDQMYPELEGITREAKLANKNNADIGKAFTKYLAQENAAGLARNGVAPTESNVYLAHFLGLPDAIKLIEASNDDLAEKFLSKKVVESNPEVLKGKTVGDVRQWALQKSGQNDRVLAGGMTAQENFDADMEAKIAALRAQTLAYNRENTKEYTVQKTLQEWRLKAEKEGVELDEVRLANLQREVEKNWDELHAKEQLKKAEEEANGLYALRNSITQNIDLANNRGNFLEAEQMTKALDDVNGRLTVAVDKAIELAETLQDEKTLAAMQNLKLQIEVNKNALVSAKQVNDIFASAGSTAFDSVAKSIAAAASGTQKWSQTMRDMGNVVRQFFADILVGIAKAIAQAAILQAMGIDANGSGGIGGWLVKGLGVALSAWAGSGTAGTTGTEGMYDVTGADMNHGGNFAGFGTKHNAPAAWFYNAKRFHNGGLPGLRADEIPTILQKGEEVLSKDSPRNALNGGWATTPSVKIVNMIDAGQALSEGLGSAHGEKAILNFIRANQGTVRSALGVT